MKRSVGWGVLLLVCTLAPVGSADLHSDVERVKLSVAQHSRLARLPPRLMERGETRRIFLPARFLDGTTRTCATLIVLGASSTSFVLRTLPDEDGDLQRGWPEASVAGLVEVVRCGSRKPLSKSLAVEMRSPRGVLEFLVLESRQPLPSAFKLLKHRRPGPPGETKNPGPRPRSGELEPRVQAALKRFKAERYNEVVRRDMKSSRSGKGDKLLRLDTGCHEIQLLGAPSNSDEPLDIDAILFSVADGERLAEDRSSNADAVLSLCVGRSVIAKLSFRGAVEHDDVALLQGRWNLPSGLPVHWGPSARSSMARALGRHLFQAVEAGPVFSRMGVQGGTRLGIPVEPGSCYLLGASPIRGHGGTIVLEATSGATLARSRGAQANEGTALAFCAGVEPRAHVEIEAYGPGMSWLMGVWQTGRVELGVER